MLIVSSSQQTDSNICMSLNWFLKNHCTWTFTIYINQRCNLVFEKKKEIVAKRSERRERSARPSWRGAPPKGPWWGSRGRSPPKLMDFSLLKTHLEGSCGTGFLAFCLFVFLFSLVAPGFSHFGAPGRPFSEDDEHTKMHFQQFLTLLKCHYTYKYSKSSLIVF